MWGAKIGAPWARADGVLNGGVPDTGTILGVQNGALAPYRGMGNQGHYTVGAKWEALQWHHIQGVRNGGYKTRALYRGYGMGAITRAPLV